MQFNGDYSVGIHEPGQVVMHFSLRCLLLRAAHRQVAKFQQSGLSGLGLFFRDQQVYVGHGAQARVGVNRLQEGHAL